MHVPREFSVKNFTEILHFLDNNSFGTLIIANDTHEPIATHIPFLIDAENETLILEGHLAKANQQSLLLNNGKPVLAIFQGPDAYISSAVYSHQNVPTWNYQSVHVYGKVEILTDQELIQHLSTMVDKNESKREKPLEYDKIPDEMLIAMRREIVGFRIKSYKLEAAYKLSQNRSDKDFENIIHDLEQSSENSELIKEMKRTRN